MSTIEEKERKEIAMNNILQLAERYDHAAHMKSLIYSEKNIMDQLILISDSMWKTNEEKCPYEVLTFLLDSYYCLPKRPDLASLFGWQAINRIYNELTFAKQSDTEKPWGDAKGIKFLIDCIDERGDEFYPYLEPYFEKMPEKLYRFVARYLIDGCLIEEIGKKKYLPHSYRTVKFEFENLVDNIKKSYAIAMKNKTNPRIENGKFVKKKEKETAADLRNSRNIVGNLAKKLKELIASGKVSFQLKDKNETTIHMNFTNKERLKFVVLAILYASRCNNLHGNVESRMNSPYADLETFEAYTNVFLIEYMIIAIGLVLRGQMPAESLKKLQGNYSLLIE